MIADVAIPRVAHTKVSDLYEAFHDCNSDSSHSMTMWVKQAIMLVVNLSMIVIIYLVAAIVVDSLLNEKG